jgi:hypothetical protein
MAGMLSCQPQPEAEGHGSLPKLELLSVDKIWDQGMHNAFTDLTRFRDQFYCVFREAEGHVSPAGKIRVLSSADGVTWNSSALMELKGHDLRDPKIVVHPDGKRLMINGGAAVREGNEPAIREHSFVSFSEDGIRWSRPEWVAKGNQWLWRISWFQGKAYGVAYNVVPESRSKRTFGSSLLVSDSGTDFSAWVEALCVDGGPTEATLRFDSDETGYCLQRRDGLDTNTALLGVALPPYLEWEWKDLGHYLGGPNFIRLPGGIWIAAGRLIDDEGQRTVLQHLNVEDGITETLLTLPSGGDTSYPGLFWHDNILWVSYYSSHEERTSIYLAQVAVGD